LETSGDSNMGNETYNDRLRKQLLNQRKTIQEQMMKIEKLAKETQKKVNELER